ncbi:MAG TPA: hypothetical protein VGZ25_09370 [Gemmataceae bacterium]|nr:hypothetical protein [Gemmataceae bacterium]
MPGTRGIGRLPAGRGPAESGLGPMPPEDEGGLLVPPEVRPDRSRILATPLGGVVRFAAGACGGAVGAGADPGSDPGRGGALGVKSAADPDLGALTGGNPVTGVEGSLPSCFDGVEGGVGV